MFSYRSNGRAYHSNDVSQHSLRRYDSCWIRWDSGRGRVSLTRGRRSGRRGRSTRRCVCLLKGVSSSKKDRILSITVRKGNSLTVKIGPILMSISLATRIKPSSCQTGCLRREKLAKDVPFPLLSLRQNEGFFDLFLQGTIE